MNKNNKILLSTSAVVLALAMALSPYALSQSVFAGGYGNFAEQIISQIQESEQNSQVVSGGDTSFSGNNINVHVQSNTGSNALAQD
jgi:uncharacterized protein (UPF0333 family)